MAAEMVALAGKWGSGVAAVQVDMQVTAALAAISLVFQAQMALLV